MTPCARCSTPREFTVTALELSAELGACEDHLADVVRDVAMAGADSSVTWEGTG